MILFMRLLFTVPYLFLSHAVMRWYQYLQRLLAKSALTAAESSVPSSQGMSFTFYS
jgi:hypothetical protein